MDFLDPDKKRSHRHRLYAGYILTTIAILLATTLLLYIASGYGIGPKGEVIQNGLVFIDAKPESATATITGEGKTYVEQTDVRKLLPEGSYHVDVTRAGYRTWSRDFTLRGGSIERFVYPLLIPETLVSTDIKTYAANPTIMSQSPDQRWLLVSQSSGGVAFDVFDLRANGLASRTATLPATILTDPVAASTYEVIEWSDDNRHVLLKRNFSGRHEYIVFDHVDPAASRNISTQFAVANAQITLRDQQPDLFYILKDDGAFHSADGRSSTVSAVLARGVKAYASSGNDLVMYVSIDGASEGKAQVRILDKTTPYTLREVSVADRYLLALAQYDGNWQYAVGSPTDKRIYVYRNPLSSLKEQSATPAFASVSLRVENPLFLSFSEENRFVALQGGKEFAVYDAETERAYHYDVAFNVENTIKATWMDEYRLVLRNDKMLTIFDHDGSNSQSMVDASTAPYAFDQDFETLYTFGPSIADSAVLGLRSTAMRAAKN